MTIKIPRYNTAKAKLYTLLCAVICILAIPTCTTAQVNVQGNQTANALAQALLGTGVTLTNPTLTCPSNANGLFQVVSSNLGLDSGVVLTSGQAQTTAGAVGVNGTGQFVSTSNNAPGDAQLNALSGQTTHDACILEFDFIPQGDTVKFKYVFGSQEYTNYSCSSFNDVFGFFISGPAITGSANMALIPGTTIPVAINSTTNTAVNNPGSLALCTAMGPGSPFAQYYVNNYTTVAPPGTTINYPGFTTVLTAFHPVVACQTYHLKMAVADASDGVLDSGVFIEGGSLTSNASASVSSFGSGGLPYCVRGCLPGKFVFTRAQALSTPAIIHYTIVGTAVNGYDYAPIADSIVIPAGMTTFTQYIYGLNVPAAGPKTVGLIIQNTVNCLTTTDTSMLTIYDSIYTKILTNDTVICQGNTVHITAEGDSILSYSWTPTAGLTRTDTLVTDATPLGTTTYVLTSNLPGAGCPDVHNSITIVVDTIPTVTVTPDTIICLGMSVQLNTTTSPQPLTNPYKPYTYSWAPASSGLSNDTIPNPVAHPLVTTAYTVTVKPVAIGCSASATVNITVLPNDFTLENPDTAICKGNFVTVRANGDPHFTFLWNPTSYVSNPFIIAPVITPDTSETYTIVGSFPGCPPMIHSFHIDVQPVPTVDLGPDREVCEWDTLHLHADVQPAYSQYTYQWSPATHLDYPTQVNVVFDGLQDTVMVFTATTPIGCADTDTMNIKVWPGNFASLIPTTDTGICPGDSIRMIVSGTGVTFKWTPDLYLDNGSSPNPISHPITNIDYGVLVTDIHGCHDTFQRRLTIRPQAVLGLPDSVTIYPGESTMLNPAGNCIANFLWYPSMGLSQTNTTNPIAMPDITTMYHVTGQTDWGCIGTDSITVIVRNQSIVEVPNVFVPGSGPGSELKILSKGIATLKNFSIFNRWGNKVFETSDVNEGWNGKFNGEPQPLGVYVYILEAYTNDGQKIYKQGNITLIR